MARARRGDLVDGVLLLDKPSGITSNHALQKARRLLAAAKAGHTGTLDPLASGLLALTFGEATKFSSDLLEADKAYRATVRFGMRTTTADAEGEVIETRPVQFARADLDAMLSRFSGSIAQVPPMHSALKRDGRALYEYARDGIELERLPRAVTIHRLACVEFDGASAVLEVACSKGTYVRVLAEDLGAALGCGAHLAALRRTRVGALSLDGSVTLEALEAMPAAARREWLLPPDALLSALPRVALGESQARRFLHGNPVEAAGTAGRVRVYGPDERLLGTAEIDEHGALNPRRLIATELTAAAPAAAY
ncbi:MAG: tRNA pseudouridine(55) synthase TruB [Burkholderiaceae bacterium]|nr:tRNA pseudouridine(55) synthase TruB [Burkholderiaceae bacterium]